MKMMRVKTRMRNHESKKVNNNFSGTVTTLYLQKME